MKFKTKATNLGHCSGRDFLYFKKRRRKKLNRENYAFFLPKDQEKLDKRYRQLNKFGFQIIEDSNINFDIDGNYILFVKFKYRGINYQNHVTEVHGKLIRTSPLALEIRVKDKFFDMFNRTPFCPTKSYFYDRIVKAFRIK